MTDARRAEQTARADLPMPDVSQVIPTGGETKQYQVIVRPDRLAAFGLGVDEVVSALRGDGRRRSDRDENVERKAVVMSNVAGRDLSSVVEDIREQVAGLWLSGSFCCGAVNHTFTGVQGRTETPYGIHRRNAAAAVFG